MRKTIVFASPDLRGSVPGILRVYRLQRSPTMNIRFISTLTAEDEENFARGLLDAAAALLDQTGIAYTLRIETSTETVLQHDHATAPRGQAATAIRLPFVMDGRFDRLH